MNPQVVVLSRFPDLLEGFRANVEQYEPDVPKILVRDGNLIPVSLYPDYYPGTLWTVVDGEEPFVYAANVNFGWQVAKGDVVLCGDDIRFEGPFVKTLQELAYSDDSIGIATVQLWGQSPFVCGYFKRSVIEAVGPMDERFEGYGQDDMDWCRRMEALGYRTQPTEAVKAKHSGGTSFLRVAREKGTSMEELCNVNNRLFEEKWK